MAHFQLLPLFQDCILLKDSSIHLSKPASSQKSELACMTLSSCQIIWDTQHKDHYFQCGHSDAKYCLYYLKHCLLSFHCLFPSASFRKIKASSNIDELQDSGSHDAFGICRLIRLKNKWLEVFWAIHRELCWDETLAYEAHYDHSAALTFSTQQRKAGFSVHVNSIMKQLRGRPASATTFILLKNLQIHSSEREFANKNKRKPSAFSSQASILQKKS